METLVKWKKRRDLFQESDNVSGCGYQVPEFSERESLGGGPIGSPKNVQFIMKDETQAETLRRLKGAGSKKLKWW